MKKRSLFVCLAAATLLVACGEETRNGQLTLSGSTPLRIVDEKGPIVEFVSGPLKVEFSADKSRQFSVKLEQDSRVAKFSGRVANIDDWNFTVRGSDIGQPADFTSKRNVSLYGPIYTRWGMGGSCGFNGQWETEERWQRGNEDWTVSFKDANNGADIGAFSSRRDADYLLSVRNVWCRERPHNPYPHPLPPPHHPRDGRMHRISEKLSEIKPDAFKFE